MTRGIRRISLYCRPWRDRHSFILTQKNHRPSFRLEPNEDGDQEDRHEDINGGIIRQGGERDGFVI